MAFRGTFDHSLDAKNRLTMPAKFRAAFADGLVLVKGVELCVAAWPTETYSAQTDAALAGLNPFSPEARDLNRFFYSNAFDMELDAANRVAMPQPLLAHAGITKDVVVIGMGQYVELWDRARWHAYNDDLTARSGELTATLGHPR